VRLYSRPGNDLTHRFPRSSRRWHACARALASSTAKLSPAMTTELPRSICPGAGGIASLRGPAQVSGSCTTLCATWYTARPASHRSRRHKPMRARCVRSDRRGRANLSKSAGQRASITL
jgi:hypothetical protein